MDVVGGWVTTWPVPTNSTVGAELTLPTNITGAIAGLGSVTDAAVELETTSELPAEAAGGSEVESFAVTAGLEEADNTGAPEL